MNTYERIFQHVKPSNIQNGHALRNIENKKSLALAKNEFKKIFENLK
ncbi:hypothetical protein [Sulfurimonas sp.]|nr:hypothetical protein [Sulfurimonas sp.]